MDIAKRRSTSVLPSATVLLPAVVEEANDVEPTETESRQPGRLAAALLQIARGPDDPELLRRAPVTTPVAASTRRGRPRLHVRWEPGAPWLSDYVDWHGGRPGAKLAASTFGCRGFDSEHPEGQRNSAALPFLGRTSRVDSSRPREGAGLITAVFVESRCTPPSPAAADPDDRRRGRFLAV